MQHVMRFLSPCLAATSTPVGISTCILMQGVVAAKPFKTTSCANSTSQGQHIKQGHNSLAAKCKHWRRATPVQISGAAGEH